LGGKLPGGGGKGRLPGGIFGRGSGGISPGTGGVPDEDALSGGGKMGMPRPPGGGIIPAGGAPGAPGIPNGGGGIVPGRPGNPNGGGGKPPGPPGCGSIGLALAWPSAAYEDVIESITDCAFS